MTVDVAMHRKAIENQYKCGRIRIGWNVSKYKEQAQKSLVIPWHFTLQYTRWWYALKTFFLFCFFRRLSV